MLQMAVNSVQHDQEVSGLTIQSDTILSYGT